MEFLNQKYFPSNTEDIIKEQYKDSKNNNIIYILTTDIIKWKLYKLEGIKTKYTKLGESKDWSSLVKKIPMYLEHE